MFSIIEFCKVVNISPNFGIAGNANQYRFILIFLNLYSD